MAAISRLHHDVNKQSVLSQEDIIKNTLLFKFAQNNPVGLANRYSHESEMLFEGGVMSISNRKMNKFSRDLSLNRQSLHLMKIVHSRKNTTGSGDNALSDLKPMTVSS